MVLPVRRRRLWSEALGALTRRTALYKTARDGLSAERVAIALYRGILDREPDLGGLRDKIELLSSGHVLEEVIRTFIGSPEFRSRMLRAATPSVDLPDLTQMMAKRYRKNAYGGDAATIYDARTDQDIERMAALIERHRYYDAFGVWSSLIDLDKEVTAAIVRGLGAKSCFELGCFTGPVLSLLAEAGIEVTGAEVSHTAFTFAYPNVRHSLLYGDLLGLDIDRRFDVILCMDVLEHISPLCLDQYIARLASLLVEDGMLYVNSPMYGYDPAFGTVFSSYIDEWRSAGDGAFWRDWPCDEKGWPQHGHLVWADVNWWSRLFQAHGLVRDHAIEGVIHHRLSHFFDQAPARRTLFVLRRPNYKKSDIRASSLDTVLAQLPNLPKPAG